MATAPGIQTKLALSFNKISLGFINSSVKKKAFALSFKGIEVGFIISVVTPKGTYSIFQ